MLYFTSRDKAKKFAGQTRKVIDLGKDKEVGRRWAVKVTKSN